jgi:hypothetical protein
MKRLDTAKTASEEKGTADTEKAPKKAPKKGAPKKGTPKGSIKDLPKVEKGFRTKSLAAMVDGKKVEITMKWRASK